MENTPESTTNSEPVSIVTDTSNSTHELTIESLIGGASKKAIDKRPTTLKARLSFSPLLATINTNIPFRFIENEDGEWVMTEDEKNALMASAKALNMAAAELMEKNPKTGKHMKFLEKKCLQFTYKTRHNYISLDAYWWPELGPEKNRLHLHIGFNIVHKTKLRIAQINLARAIRDNYFKYVIITGGRTPLSGTGFACFVKPIKQDGWEPAAYTLEKAKEYVNKNKHVYNYKNKPRGRYAAELKKIELAASQQSQPSQSQPTQAHTSTGQADMFSTFEEPSVSVVNHIMTNLDTLGKTQNSPEARKVVEQELGIITPSSSVSDFNDTEEVIEQGISTTNKELPVFYFAKNETRWEDYDPDKDYTEEEVPYVYPPRENVVATTVSEISDDDEPIESTPEEDITEEYVLNPRQNRKRRLPAAAKFKRFKNQAFKSPRQVQRRTKIPKVSQQTHQSNEELDIEIPVNRVTPSWV